LRRRPFRSQPIGDGTACFCPGSGETHVLDAFPAELLNHVPEAGTISIDELAAIVAAMVGEPVEEWCAKVRSVARELIALDLLEACHH